jgi:hypothetical protein
LAFVTYPLEQWLAHCWQFARENFELAHWMALGCRARGECGSDDFQGVCCGYLVPAGDRGVLCGRFDVVRLTAPF